LLDGAGKDAYPLRSLLSAILDVLKGLSRHLKWGKSALTTYFASFQQI
jgi:hypothetical protein